MKALALNTSRRDLTAVFIIWLVLLAAAAAVYVFLRMSSLHIINHIEYVSAGRYQRTMALYAEAQKRAGKAFRKADDLNRGSQTQVLLSADDADYRAAVDLYNRALALDLNPPYSSEEQKFAYDTLAQLHDSAGRGVDQLAAQARSSLAAGDYENAELNAARIPMQGQATIERLVLLAETFLRRQAWERAETSINQLADLEKPPIRTHELRARLLHTRTDARRNLDQAAQEYEAAFKAGSKNIFLRKSASELYVERKDFAAAARILEEGLSLGQDDANYLDRLGHLQLSLNHNDEAVKAFEQAARVYAFSPSVYWGLARAYQRVGKARKSNEAMQTAMNLNPALRTASLEP